MNKPKWISVDDRLPEGWQNVVFRFIGSNILEGIEDGAVGTRIGYYSAALEEFRVDHEKGVYPATHWFPMPDEEELDQ